MSPSPETPDPTDQTASEPTPLLAARGLGCIRGERRIFANLSFSLHPGEARLLIGPNGSGKTSLLRVLALLSPPATGEILLKGEPAQDDPE
ncbi:MAG: ABC transporter ATP-binding protein, partial [Rhodospirillaceae bacterium]